MFHVPVTDAKGKRSIDVPPEQILDDECWAAAGRAI